MRLSHAGTGKAALLAVMAAMLLACVPNVPVAPQEAQAQQRGLDGMWVVVARGQDPVADFAPNLVTIQDGSEFIVTMSEMVCNDWECAELGTLDARGVRRNDRSWIVSVGNDAVPSGTYRLGRTTEMPGFLILDGPAVWVLRRPDVPQAVVDRALQDMTAPALDGTRLFPIQNPYPEA